MPEPTNRPDPDAVATRRLNEILRAADSWSKEVPAPLTPPIRAVCLRLAEMVADQRHYLQPLPQAQEQERRTVLSLLAERLRSPQVVSGLEPHLQGLSDLELRATGSWAINASAQTQWISTAIQYLEQCANRLPAGERPDAYWADDVVAGIVASVKAIIGVDELHARTEAQYAGGKDRRAEVREDY
jgi:hypothetical protein